ncbi:MAG: CDP-diacylglycerol--serine O-phosphatidyltransferase [Gammaproteobacteria bacterium RIFCSPLOWO2_02_FULL_42_9]|nr:MAG: CDP-diacylglycerol--serine O-phosphatidyltransferase [Gammaproteobacteria bacterium RIFCSPLOWO2_02_FULL_42_9]
MQDIEIKDRGKTIYLLPNLFTTAGMFAGFYAIVAAMKGLFEYAVVAIFIAMIMDSIDGRVARLTNTQSAFGAQYDSLSDMVAFGIAPALFTYAWGLRYLGKIGWLATFFYAAATGLRLARFNVHLSDTEVKTQDFLGLPCPAAAGFVISMIWLALVYHLQSRTYHIIGACLIVFTALMMVSNIPYRSFKDKDFRDKVPFLLILIVLLLFVGITLDPPHVLAAIFTLYLLSGFVAWIRRSRKYILDRRMKQ